MQAVILCGGFGTRLRPLTNKVPKPMIKIGDKPVLEHQVLLCKKYGVDDIYLAAFYMPEVIDNYFGDGSRWGVNITLSVEKKPLGGAGAIKLLENKLTKPFFVLNGDAMINIDLTKMMNFHKRQKTSVTLFAHYSNRSGEYLEVNKNNVVTIFKTRNDNQKNDNLLSKSGITIFNPELIADIPYNKSYSIEKEWIPNLIKQNIKMSAYISDEYCHDMGTPERLTKVRQDFEKGII